MRRDPEFDGLPFLMRLASPNLAYSVASSELNRHNALAIAERRSARPLQREVTLDGEGRLLGFTDVQRGQRRAAANKRARSEFEEPAEEEDKAAAAP